MTRFGSKRPEFLRSFGQEPKLVQETEWSRVYETEPKGTFLHSKFQDEGFQVSASAIRDRWPNMGKGERLDFCLAFSGKPDWDQNDTEILEIIMQDGDDVLWETLSQSFLRHPDRDRALSFLIERLHSPPDLQEERIKLNYIQALGLSKDQRAVAAIKPFYERCKHQLESGAVSAPQDSFWALVPYHEYLAICEALRNTDGSPEYEQEIRKYLNHPVEQVRWWAEYALGIEGPVTAKRNRESQEKRAPKKE